MNGGSLPKVSPTSDAHGVRGILRPALASVVKRALGHACLDILGYFGIILGRLRAIIGKTAPKERRSDCFVVLIRLSLVVIIGRLFFVLLIIRLFQAVITKCWEWRALHYPPALFNI